jgi:hypothetical protein
VGVINSWLQIISYDLGKKLFKMIEVPFYRPKIYSNIRGFIVGRATYLKDQMEE